MGRIRSKLVNPSSKEKVPRPISYFPLTTQGKIALAAWRKEHPKVKPRERPKNPKDKKSRSLLPPGELTEVEQFLKLRRTTSRNKQTWDFDRNKPITTQQKIEAAKALERTRGDPHGMDWKVIKQVKIPGLPEQFRRLGQLYPRLELQSFDEVEKQFVIPVMEFPGEIRNLIWKFAVVNTTSFVWPESRKGRKKPTLAWVSKAVQREVLSIYYGCNTFGLSLSSGARPSAADSGIAKIRGWINTLERTDGEEDGSWLKMIKNWAFELNRKSVVGDDQSILVLVKLPHEASRDDFRAPEIHRDATCVLPGWDNCSRCLPGRIPDKFKMLVDKTQQSLEESGGANPVTLIRLTQRLQGMKHELFAAQCQSDLD